MDYRIPKTLDNPIRCLGIPIDTLMVFLMIWSSFVLFDRGLYGIPVGLIASFFFSRIRSRSMLRKLLRFIYWYLPAEMNFIQGVKGHQRILKMNRDSSNSANSRENSNSSENSNSRENIENIKNIKNIKNTRY
jgi:conjugal transfer pilus assembly protein TraL